MIISWGNHALVFIIDNRDEVLKYTSLHLYDMHIIHDVSDCCNVSNTVAGLTGDDGCGFKCTIWELKP